MKSQHIDIVPIDHIDDSRVIEVVFVPEESTNVVEPLLESSTPIFVVNTGIPYMFASDIINKLA